MRQICIVCDYSRDIIHERPGEVRMSPGELKASHEQSETDISASPQTTTRTRTNFGTETGTDPKATISTDE